MEFHFNLSPISLKCKRQYIYRCQISSRSQFDQSFLCFLKTFESPISQLLLCKQYLSFSHLDKRLLPHSKARIDYYLIRAIKVLEEFYKSKIYKWQLLKQSKLYKRILHSDNEKKVLFFILDHCFYTYQCDLALSQPSFF